MGVDVVEGPLSPRPCSDPGKGNTISLEDLAYTFTDWEEAGGEVIQLTDRKALYEDRDQRFRRSAPKKSKGLRPPPEPPPKKQTCMKKAVPAAVPMAEPLPPVNKRTAMPEAGGVEPMLVFVVSPDDSRCLPPTVALPMPLVVLSRSETKFSNHGEPPRAIPLAANSPGGIPLPTAVQGLVPMASALPIAEEIQLPTRKQEKQDKPERKRHRRSVQFLPTGFESIHGPADNSS
eukprot:Hpha_TRINITY_DN14727_c0_g1::TRINITY_DN14727_c0_g1_i1::g.102448::m.102448